MANIQEAIRRLRIETTTPGADEAVQKLGAISKGQDAVGAAAEKTTQKMSAYDAALLKQTRTLAAYHEVQQKMLAAAAQNAAAVQQNTAALVAANDNYAKSQSYAESATRAAAKAAIDQGAGYLATAGKIGATVLIMGGLLGVLGTVYLAYKILKTGIDLVADSWELGGQKLAEYRQIAEKAAAVDLSTQYFQRIGKAAGDAKLPVDDLAASFKKLAEVSQPKLGGSDLQNRLDASIKAGNFAGNSGVTQLAAANTTEEKFRAIVSLTDQAFKKGEALAALDITSKFLSPAAQAALVKDNEYLHNMQAAADKIAATTLVSDADIGRALAMQAKWDAAVAILETRWHPLQGLMTSAGIAMQEAWVNIVSSIASAVDWATRLIMKLGEAPAWFQNKLNQAATAFMEATTTPESRKAAETSLGISSDPADIAATVAANARIEAVARLTAGLQNQKAIEQAVAQVNAVQNSVWKDTSHAIDTEKKSLDDVRDAYDRARDAAQKHYAQTVADSDAIGLGIGAQAEFRTKAALTTAALIAQREMTPQLTAEINAYGQAARTAAEANERLKIGAQIKFERASIGLSPDDVAIASALKGLYPDVTTALNSTEAAEMRVNQQLRLSREIASGFSNDLVSGLLRGENGMKSLTTAATNLNTKLASKNLTNFLNGGSFFGTQSLNSAQGALGIGSAGLAAYQSGNPLTGALGGAMAGATFGPAGAAIGGIAGLIGGIIGADAQSREKLQKARAEWETTAPTFASFLQPAPAVQKPTNENERKKPDERLQYHRAA